MEFVKKHFIKIIIIAVCIVLFFIDIMFVLNKITDDNTSKAGIGKVYYRTYTEKSGWSSWKKNGKTSGNLKDDITNIQIKVKDSSSGLTGYRFYNSEEDWTNEFNYKSNNKALKSITGFKAGLTGMLSKKYNICYRTYNKTDGWLEWTCSDTISGNKDVSISGIEIKVIPKNVILKDYLKDYNKTANTSSVNFMNGGNENE